MTIIRHADESDLAALSALARLCFTDTFGDLYSKENLAGHLAETCSPKFFKKCLTHDTILLAENSELIGYMKYGELTLPIDLLPQGAKEIHRLYIHPEHKSKGIGRSLMRHALNDPDIKHAEHHYLSVYEDNIPAQKFYQHYGFAIIGEYDYHVGSHIDREFIMHKKITKAQNE